MGFYSPARRTGGGAITTCAYNSTTKVLSGTVTYPGGTISGLTVNAYTVSGGVDTPRGSPATTDAGGNWSIDLSAVTGINDVSRSFKAVVTYTSAATGLTEYTVAVATAVLSGNDVLQRGSTGTTGLNGSAAETTATLTRTANAISGISIVNAGFNYEPGEWQIVTTGTGGGTGFRGAIQANSSGVLDSSTFTVTGTDAYGGTLSGGSGYTSNPSSVVLSRYVTKGVLCFFFQQGATTNGDIMFQVGSNLIVVTLLTGFYPRIDLNNANATTGARMLANGQALGAGVMRRILIAFDTTKAANAGGIRVYLDDTDISNYTAVNGYVWNTTSAGTLNGRLNLNNTGSGSGLWGPSSGTGTAFSKGSAQLGYVATGYSAIDGIAGTTTVPDISQLTVRNRFTFGSINLSDGTGGTGRQPNIFCLGQDFATGVNRGFCGALTATGDFA